MASAESAGLEALLQLLREEQRALLARDFERVHILARAKNEHLARLRALGEARSTALRRRGLSVDPAGINALLARGALEPGPWERLLALAAESREINRVNGRLINAQIRFTNGALVALSSASCATYGADGRKTALPAPRTFASA